MKIITAHDLRTGEVVYWTRTHGWTKCLEEAAPIEEKATEAALANAKAQATIVTNTYLVSIEGPGRPSAREYLRESIRARGPTVRRDLGKQAESAR